MNPEEKVVSLTPEVVKVIEDTPKRCNYVEVKIEDGLVVIIEVHHKKGI